MTILIIAIFILGYALIVLEHTIHIDKAASALLTGVLCWTVYILGSTDMAHKINHDLAEHISEVAGIVFFLIGAMTIVELIDLYGGFQIVVKAIKTTSKRTFLLIISMLAFFLSAILDNLTTAIVMGTLVSKVLSDKEDKLICLGMIVIAANAGGAWSPIGDVTTTMLWVGNQIEAGKIMKNLFLPSVISCLIPLSILVFRLKGTFVPQVESKSFGISDSERNIILFSGLGLLIFVPIFKTITHLPPFMGMLFSVSILWFISERLRKPKQGIETSNTSIFAALERIDLPSILFFIGILIAVSALQSSGILSTLATSLTSKVQNENIILIGTGILSAIVDNVPLVAALQGMYSLEQYPTGHHFWEFLAYCAGTGGSILIIGSAAGVAAMGIEKIDFFWYVRKISLPALLGYLGGAAAFLLLSWLWG